MKLDQARSLCPGYDELLFVPLGGVGEIGMNCALYGHDQRWLVVDCGISFHNETPGAEAIMPDPSFMKAQSERLVGLVVTHAHEDHLGAIAYLWHHINRPVFATPFAAGLLKKKIPRN